MHAQRCEVVPEFPGRPGAVGPDQHLLTDQLSLIVAEVIGELFDGVGEDLDVVIGAVGPAITRTLTAARISLVPLPVPQSTLAMKGSEAVPARRKASAAAPSLQA